MLTRAYIMHIGETVVLFMCVSHSVHFTRKFNIRFLFLFLPAKTCRPVTTLLVAGPDQSRKSRPVPALV